MVPQHDLVLATRLSVLGNSLGRVGNTVQAVQERQRHIDSLGQLIVADRSQMRVSVRRASTAIGNAINNLNALEESVSDVEDQSYVAEAKESLHDAREEMRALTESLREATTAMESIKARTIAIVEGQQLALTLTQTLKGQADLLARDCRDLQRNLDNVRDAAVAGNGVSVSAMGGAWEEYDQTLFQKSSALFAEYVDFLGGLTLREAGLDEGVCETADALVQQLEVAFKIDWKSLTIPAHREAASMTPARIIRLGFPEWTIWPLPLTAHDYGDIVAMSDRTLIDLVDRVGGVQAKSRRQELVADVIATYATGPAYCCAMVLLRLNPIEAYSARVRPGAPPPHHAQRAEAIFATLEMMDGANGSYATIIGMLRHAWYEAIAQAHPALGRVGYESEVKAWLKLERGVWLGEAWEYLENDAEITRPFTTAAWDTTKPWIEPMRRNAVEAIEPNGVVAVGVLHVLNAAWNCRVQHPEAMSEIESAANALLVKIKHPPTVDASDKPRPEDKKRLDPKVSAAPRKGEL